MTEHDNRRGNSRTGVQRTGELLAKAACLFVILEPIWMLLPFAGFLYGSGLRIQSLARHSETAWLTHFVFPVLTLGWTGPILVTMGAVLFLVGAGQIYWAKLRRKGLVRNGLYRYVRHPQYTALMLFSVGLLLTWGRAVMFLAFFVMMFLYYELAKKEERDCATLFGEQYEHYRNCTAFCIPGDQCLRRLSVRLPLVRLPRALRFLLSFAAVILVALGCMWIIRAVRVRVRCVPFIVTKIQFGTESVNNEQIEGMWTGRTNGVPFVCTDKLLLVRGPWRNAAAPGFAENTLCRLLSSAAMAEFVKPIAGTPGHAAVVFCAPVTPPGGESALGKEFLPKDPIRRGPEPLPDGPDCARLIMMRCKLREGTKLSDVFLDKANRTILAMCVAETDLSIPEDKDFVVEGPFLRGPMCPKENRWDYLMNRLAQREALLPKKPDRPLESVPPRSTQTDVLLVQAPVLRTRLEPRFAEDILRRLARSRSFQDRIRKVGAGGNIVPVVFPRPGPNWYHTYHFHYHADGDRSYYMDTHGEELPQISAFVLLVRRDDAVAWEQLFRESHRAERELLGAFIAELDFALEPPLDPVREIVIVGPRRDLEERWDFFLSSL